MPQFLQFYEGLKKLKHKYLEAYPELELSAFLKKNMDSFEKIAKLYDNINYFVKTREDYFLIKRMKEESDRSSQSWKAEEMVEALKILVGFEAKQLSSEVLLELKRRLDILNNFYLLLENGIGIAQHNGLDVIPEELHDFVAAFDKQLKEEREQLSSLIMLRLVNNFDAARFNEELGEDLVQAIHEIGTQKQKEQVSRFKKGMMPILNKQSLTNVDFSKDERLLIAEKIIDHCVEVFDQNRPLSIEERKELLEAAKKLGLEKAAERVNYAERVDDFVTSEPAVEKEDIMLGAGASAKEVVRERKKESWEETRLAAALLIIDSYLGMRGKQAETQPRHGRAEHLKMKLEYFIDAIQESSTSEERSEKYNAVIGYLFLHYQSISNSKSDLSLKIERALVELLNFKFDNTPYVQYTKAVDAREKASVFHAVETFFAPEKDKKADPVFLFLRKYILTHRLAVRAAFFEREPDLVRGKEYVLTEPMQKILTQLEEKDKIESALFKGKGASVNSDEFEEILSNKKPSGPK